jgi:hypothetical protein
MPLDHYGHTAKFMITFLLSYVLEIALGLLFWYGLLTLLSRRDEQAYLRLVPYQFTLGYLAVGFGLWRTYVAVNTWGNLT